MTRAIIEQRKREAIALVRKGGLSAKIGLAFLKQFGANATGSSEPANAA